MYCNTCIQTNKQQQKKKLAHFHISTAHFPFSFLHHLCTKKEMLPNTWDKEDTFMENVDIHVVAES